MLEKGWENEELSISNTFNNLYLIAARSNIKCSLPTYLDIIREEFSKATINEKEKNLLLNLRGRVPMDKDDIDLGIELGIKLLKNKDYSFNNLDSKPKKMTKTML